MQERRILVALLALCLSWMGEAERHEGTHETVRAFAKNAVAADGRLCRSSENAVIRLHIRMNQSANSLLPVLAAQLVHLTVEDILRRQLAASAPVIQKKPRCTMQRGFEKL